MLPQELRDHPQWLVSGEDKAPRSPKTEGKLADVRDKALHVTFDEATAFASQHGLDVGFALTAEDPFTVIDLDTPETEEQQQRHQKILTAFQSYAELSKSGAGVHIWVRGKVPKGARRDKVEVYPADRYMICTGNTIRDLPITENPDLLQMLFEEISRNGSMSQGDLVELDALLTDVEVFEMGMRASNSDKFDALCRGEWQDNYPSQSEADYALMNILTFYSRSNLQCKRLFRMSALGKRAKAQREKYLDAMIGKIRNEEPQPIDFSGLKVAAEIVFVDEAVPVSEDDWQKLAVSVPQADAEVPSQVTKSQAVAIPQSHIPYPPGFIGEIAQYIVDSSTRPVPEIGIAAALGLSAGILGRQFNISGTGLNQYIILLAKTGVGKEGGPNGIERILSAARPLMPVVDEFMGPGTFASGQAIIRHLDEKPSFVSLLGEFGLTLQNLTDNQNELTRVMRKVLLDLYSKSGKASLLYPTAYSDKMKNTKTLYAPSLTILGESTPDSFFAGLSEAHIMDGLIPRFLIIDYEGDRPPKNENAFWPPSDLLLQRFVHLVETALRMQTNNVWQDVTLNVEAKAVLDVFDRQCDSHIRAGSSEGQRQLWNRAHLKALRLSALLAAADRPHEPVVLEDEAQWAIQMVTKDVMALAARFARGDVGTGGNKQTSDMIRIIRDFLERSEPGALKSYGVTPEMQAARVIPYIYFRRRLGPLAAFDKDRRGVSAAVKATMEDMELSGMIEKVPRQQCRDVFNYRGMMSHITEAFE